MSKPKTFTWTVEFTVAECWVEDGFDLTDDRALHMLATDLGWANMATELKAKVVKRPAAARIRKVQGYPDPA